MIYLSHQGILGLRQCNWTKDQCVYPIMMNKITPHVDQNYLFTLIKILKVPNVFLQMIGKCDHETLITILIYSPVTPPSLTWSKSTYYKEAEKYGYKMRKSSIRTMETNKLKTSIIYRIFCISLTIRKENIFIIYKVW